MYAALSLGRTEAKQIESEATNDGQIDDGILYAGPHLRRRDTSERYSQCPNERVPRWPEQSPRAGTQSLLAATGR